MNKITEGEGGLTKALIKPRAGREPVVLLLFKEREEGKGGNKKTGA